MRYTERTRIFHRHWSIGNSFPGSAVSEFQLGDLAGWSEKKKATSPRRVRKCPQTIQLSRCIARIAEADQAVKELQRGGVDLHKLSIVGKGYHTDEQAVGYYNTGDRMKYWGKVGAFWGGFWGLLFGSALFIIPGLGPILAAGPVVAWIVAGMEGAVEVGALGALGAGLYSIGIPKDSIVKYETALKTDQFLLIVHGTAAEVAQAKDIIETTNPVQFSQHSGGEVAIAA